MSEIYPIAVPKWGIEMVEGTINAWNKQEGDSVAKGDEVFEMESDKIVNVWDSPTDGVLRRIIAQEGDAHPVGALLGVIAAAAIDALEADGVSCDLIDPRTTSPLDTGAILESVEATGRLVVVDEAPPRCGLTADVAALAADKAFHALKAPVKQVCAPHSPTPFSPELEAAYIPSVEQIQSTIREVLG